MNAPEKIYLNTYDIHIDPETTYWDVKPEFGDSIEYTRSDLMRWRPIETVPKDGTRILVLKEWYGHIDLAQWFPDRVPPRGYVTPLKEGLFHATGTRINNSSQITHWMPLPAPPKEGES